MSNTSKAAGLFARLRNLSWLYALLPACTSLVVPAMAWGDIYKWADEKGGTHYADSPPPTTGELNNVEVVEKEIKPTPTEQTLLSRIQSLERQLQAPQYAAQAPAAQPPMAYRGYTSSMPPPSNYYDGGYDSSYNSSYSASLYPHYSYCVVPLHSYVIFARRTLLARPAFVASRGGIAHAAGGRRGKR